MTYRMGVDVGGTFTDLVLFNEENGEVLDFKVPTVTQALTKGVSNVIAKAAKHYGRSVDDVLDQTTTFVHGTTVAVNAILQNKTCKTGLICTRGFRYILWLRDGEKPQPTFDYKMEPPEPYVPIYLTLEVTERIDVEGNVLIPLNEGEVRRAIRQFKQWDVESIAVALLWSVANPIHEQRIGEIIQEEWPQVTFSLSSHVLPLVREWPRTSATAIDASLKPLLKEYAESLQKELMEHKFRPEFLMVIATGGVLPGMSVSDKPVYNCLSGPTCGPVAGLYFSELINRKNIITADVGGTSFDISLVKDGRIAYTQDARVGWHLLGIPTVDVTSIGAGGGSIAWLDSQKVIHVGPESAGAIPGPACYMRGGTEPTVCDADVILGYLDPDHFLGGKMKINVDAAAHAIKEKIAKPLKIDVEEAAWSIYGIVNQNMVTALVDISVKRGVDPRDFVIVSGGGAGGMHIPSIAKQLEVKEVLAPKLAGTLCAFGMLCSDVKYEVVGTLRTSSRNFDAEGTNRILDELEREAAEALEKAGVTRGQIEFDTVVGMRYPYQIYELDVPLGSRRISLEQIPDLINRFHSIHEATYGFKIADEEVEIIWWRVSGIVRVSKPSLSRQEYGGEDASPAFMGRRKACFDGHFVDTPYYNGEELVYGNKIDGPAIVEEVTSTLVIPPGAKATVTEIGDYFVELP